MSAAATFPLCASTYARKFVPSVSLSMEMAYTRVAEPSAFGRYCKNLLSSPVSAAETVGGTHVPCNVSSALLIASCSDIVGVEEEIDAVTELSR